MREHLTFIAIDLLQQLVVTPSFSKEESKTAGLLMGFFEHHGIKAFRKGNNVWAINEHFDAKKPTLLLNSHHDTENTYPGYPRDPLAPHIVDDKLYGL